MNDRELKAFVELHLQMGDSREKIEQFFEGQGWNYSFNRFNSWYGSRYIPGCYDTWDGGHSGVAIRIHVDESRRVKYVEIIRMTK